MTKQSSVTPSFCCIQKRLLKLHSSLTLVSSPLAVFSRPSARRQASWLCGSGVWKSPTRTSKSPRRTSCTRSRRARRRGFTSNLHSHPFSYLSLCEREEAAAELSVSPERVLIYFVHVMSGLSHSLVTVICKDNKQKNRKCVSRF